jgi:hypothetical protein
MAGRVTRTVSRTSAQVVAYERLADMAEVQNIFTSQWIDILLASAGYTNRAQISELFWIETPGPGNQEFTIEIKFKFEDAKTREVSDRSVTIIQTYQTT